MPAQAPAPSIKSLQETDSLTISQFADLFGFPASAVLAAIENNSKAIKKPFYSIPDLAARWDCSRATVYSVLKESEFKVLNLARRNTDKGKKLVPAAIVEQIERFRMQSLTETAA
jgi:hypothetical protein